MVRVIGPVIDVEFPPSELPEVHTALTVDLTLEGESTTIYPEVAQHIGDSIVRHRPEADRRPGARHPVKNTGRSHRPRGGGRARPRLQRDRRAPRRGPVEIHERPLADAGAAGFAELEPKKQMLETGIKVIDLLEPYVQVARSACSAAPASARP